MHPLNEIPLFQAHLVEGSVAREPRVVDQDRGRAELLDHAINGVRHRLRIAHVGLGGHRLTERAEPAAAPAHRSPSTSISATAHPSLASRSAMPSPMPPAAPVTIATRLVFTFRPPR